MGEKVENRTSSLSDTYFYFGMLFGENILSTLAFPVCCLGVDCLLSLTSLQYLNITSKLHHCTGLPS